MRKIAPYCRRVLAVATRAGDPLRLGEQLALLVADGKNGGKGESALAHASIQKYPLSLRGGLFRDGVARQFRGRVLTSF